MISKLKSLKKSILKVSVSVILLSLLFVSIDKKSLAESFEKINIAYAPLIILLIVANYVVSSIRWRDLVSIYPNSDRVSLFYLVKLYFIGSFFNNFMPTSIGGDVYKIVRLGKKIDSKSHAFSATFMERFTGVIALAFISLLGFVVTLVKGIQGLESDFWVLGAACLIVLVGFVAGTLFGIKLLGLLKKKVSKLEKIYDSLIQYKDGRRILVGAFLTSFIVQLCAIFTQYFILVSLGSTVDVFRALFIFPLITLASFFIPSLNGIGVQDFLYKFSNVFLMIGEPTAIAGSILYHLFRLFVSMFGGLFYGIDKSD